MSTIKRLHLWLPPLLYMALIFHFSSQSNPLPELTSRVWDKALHTLEYFGLALLVCRAFLGHGVARAKSMMAAVVIASLYAMSDEWHQSFVPMRTSDVLDWMADTVGSMLGAGLLPALGEWPKRALLAPDADPE